MGPIMAGRYDNRLQVRVDAALMRWLAGRAELMHNSSGDVQASADVQARVELGLWRSALTVELGRLRLTLGQACCLADILNGAMLDANLGKVVWMEAVDGFQIARQAPVPDLSSYGRKWDIDEARLLDWLSGLSPVADHALREAIAVWWQRGLPGTVEGFAEAGLTVLDRTTGGGCR